MAFYLGKEKQKVVLSESMLGGGTTRPVETKTVSYDRNGAYKVTPSSGYVMSEVNVTVNVPPKEEQEKSRDITVNGTYSLTPDYNKVLSKATVNVNVPSRYDEGFTDGQTSGFESGVISGKEIGRQEGYQQGKTEGYNEGYGVGYDKGVEDTTPDLRELTATDNTTYTPDDFDGYSSVVVNVPLKYDEGFTDGRAEGYEEGYQAGLDVNDFVTGALEADENKTYYPSDYNVDGFSSVKVAVPERYDEGFEDGKVIGREEGYNEGKTDGIAEGKASIKLYDETITKSGSYTVEPKDGFDGFSSVIVNVEDRYQEGYDKGLEDAEPAEPVLESLTVTENNKTYTPSDDIDGFSEVIVAVPQKTEVDLEETIAENHKTFTYEPEDGETFKKVIINVSVPTEIEGEFNGVVLLAEGSFRNGETFYHICDNGWAIIDGEGVIDDCEGYNDDPLGTGVNSNPPSPFWDYDSITHVYIADGITHIGAGLFVNCTNIEEVRLPDGLYSIGVSAFENTGISKIYLPNSITGIGSSAFYGCDNLTDVYYNGTKSDWDDMWGGSGLFAETAIDDAGLAYATLHCEYEEPTGGDTPELTTETWTFEMEDGSIVTKEVVIV